MASPPDLLILGASTRAAAMSALRAGLAPACIDVFGDRDLAAIAPVLRATGDERLVAFERPASKGPDVPWLYTGPIENDPELVERCSTLRRLLGQPAGVLRAVRDPFRVAAFLKREDLAHAEVVPAGSAVARDGSWLVKPLASGGGRLIQPLVEGPAGLAEPSYLQRFIPGPSGSAVYVAHRGRARLIGVTRQFHGEPAGRFAYRGNVGPIDPGAAATSRLARLGEALATGFGLVGLFGVDFILAGGEPWLVEVNPRYTASVEVLELATRRSLLGEHVAACESVAEPASRESGRPGRVVGKQVLYAEGDLITPDFALDLAGTRERFAVPEVADIPWPGTRMSRGEPILTVLAEGPDEEACLAQLAARAARWQAVLHEG